MLLDLVALGILCLFVLMGALRGGVATVASLATLLSGYGAAVWAAGTLGEKTAAKLGLPALAGPPIAGTAAFLIAALFVGALGMLIKHWARTLRGDSPMGAANRWLGGLAGAFRGALVVLLLSWLVIWLDAARATGSFSGLEAVPNVESSSVARITEKVVAKVVSAAAGDNGVTSEIVVRFASRPGDSVRSLQAILASPQIEALQRDRLFWTLIENGAYSRAMNRASFSKIVNDVALRAHFATVGVVSSEAAIDGKVFRTEFGAVLSEVGPRVKGLSEDPELQKLARDPEITSLLESGDALGLMRHDGIQRLASRVASGGS